MVETMFLRKTPQFEWKNKNKRKMHNAIGRKMQQSRIMHIYNIEKVCYHLNRQR